MSIIIGIDHGYYAIKTAHCSFPAGLTSYGEHEPYTRQGHCLFFCMLQSFRSLIQNFHNLTTMFQLLGNTVKILGRHHLFKSHKFIMHTML